MTDPAAANDFLQKIGATRSVRRDVVLAAAGVRTSRLLLTRKGVETLPQLGNVTGKGLHWRVLPQRFRLQTDPTLAYSNEMAPGSEGRQVVLLGTDEGALRELDDMPSDATVGALLGIPPCCVVAYLDRAATALSVDGDFTALTRRPVLTVPAIENPVGRYFDRGFFDHFVCEVGCRATREVALRHAQALMTFAPQLAFELLSEGTFLHRPGEGVHRIGLMGAAGETPCLVHECTNDKTPFARRIRAATAVRATTGGRIALQAPNSQWFEEDAWWVSVRGGEPELGLLRLDDLHLHPVPSSRRLDERRVAILGATGEVGRLAARRCSVEGADLVLVARSAAALSHLVANIDGEHCFIAADLTTGVGRNSLVQSLVAWDVDTVVMCFGNATQDGFARLEALGLRHALEVHLISVHEVLQSLYRARPSTSVVLVGSSRASVHDSRRIAYSAAKAGLRAYAEASAIEIAGSGGRLQLLELDPVSPEVTGSTSEGMRALDKLLSVIGPERCAPSEPGSFGRSHQGIG